MFLIKPDILKKFLENIDKQFQSNKGKNIFSDGIQDSLKFIPETIRAIEQIGEIDKVSENILIDYITNRALDEFCRVNQYYSFDKQARERLRTIYAELFMNIKNYSYPADSVSRIHYENLTRWLRETNSFAEKIYSGKNENIEPVACSEYSAGLQVELLQIDITRLIEPVLDVGCGKQGNLVYYFRELGFEACGFDRFAFEKPFLTRSDWFDYDFGSDKWGTIISNLGFTNHFKHHHFRNDGDFINYAKTYMDILQSLKIGGKFYYAPGISFIESYLDINKYKLAHGNIGNYEFKSVIIERLK
ncbi:MAG: hypothetical protein A2X13_15030 [Bacteroidetes bacterium GWC2_33_15]|nr:MAG: hypothetical protein A2X10_07095 [Bacteroidetes bacterium GWA2_33_15]OFX50183.1 MAG: hypothetical protein A2X13_15030 [Bacteroidetes bacterium GWC2_33_15]OFX65335.1 MAG: hypothetical protein A2X15_04605 [Bacteroidetes bacterium GWB2_32_14]OFX70562.1 MAG: hypothetical protein A2X14_04660 [Bacteroidetes bacterium GWD2_33_33]HAN19564.1 hypothetical protein [Bacteroidales bacterium]